MSYTLAQLRTQAREASDKEDDLHVSDSELTTYINNAGRALHDLVTASNEDYFLTSVEFTLTSANTYTPSGSTFYKLRGVDYRDGERWIKVNPFNFAERERYREADYDGTYRLWYLPKFVALSADGDTLDDRYEQWAEYVVLSAARKCLRKEESDTREIDQEIAALADNIRALTQKRDAGGPRRVAEVRRPMHDDWRDDEIFETENASGRAYRLQGNTVFIVSRGAFRR